MKVKLTKDLSTAVAPSVKLFKVDARTPKGVKLILCNKPDGILYFGVLTATVKTPVTHWFPCPTFPAE